MVKGFTTAARRKKPIRFDLDGEAYTFTPPKSAGPLFALLEADDGDELAGARVQFDWLGAGLADGQSEKLIARLKDPEDDLDVEDLRPIIEWLQEQISGRPTG